MSISHTLIDKSVDSSENSRRAGELAVRPSRPTRRRGALDGRNINRNRALLIRWSKKPENHLALLQLACGLIAFKKAHAARLAHALPG